MTLVGYSDRPSVAPGDRIRFMVSCEQPAYDVRLVRLIHGDTNPSGPGFKQRLVPSAIDGRRPGKREVIRSGSYVDVALDGVDLSREVTFCAFVQATNPAAGAAQVIAGQGTPLDGTGWALALSAEGDLQVIGASQGWSRGWVRCSAGRGICWPCRCGFRGTARHRGPRGAVRYGPGPMIRRPRWRSRRRPSCRRRALR